MSPRARWISGFLGATALALGAEVYASLDGSSSTVPWTDLIVEYVPGEVLALPLGGLAAWLPVHFAVRYRRRARQRRD